MVKYLVTHQTKHGGTSGMGVFNKKSEAKKAVKNALGSKAFRKLGYSNPRIRKYK